MGFLKWLRGRLRRAGEVREGLFCPEETCFGTDGIQEAPPDAPEWPYFALDALRQGNIPPCDKKPSEAVREAAEHIALISGVPASYAEHALLATLEVSCGRTFVTETGPLTSTGEHKPREGYTATRAAHDGIVLNRNLESNNWRRMHGLPMKRRAAMRRLHARRGR